MKIKTAILLLITFLCSTTIMAQEVNLKKGLVLIDGEARFEYERRAAGNELSIYTMGKENEILFIMKNNNETAGYLDDDFIQITFVNEKAKLENATYRGYPYKWFLQKLIRERVLGEDGKLDTEKLEVFLTKYDENITNRTIRY